MIQREPGTEPTTEAGRRLLTELSESPLPGARYAHHVVELRLPAIEAEARQQGRDEGATKPPAGT